MGKAEFFSEEVGATLIMKPLVVAPFSPSSKQAKITDSFRSRKRPAESDPGEFQSATFYFFIHGFQTLRT